MTDEQERDNREAHERRELIKSLASEMPSYSDFISRLKKHAELKKLGSRRIEEAREQSVGRKICVQTERYEETYGCNVESDSNGL